MPYEDARARTRLAWQRTGLALAAIATLIASAGLHRTAGLLILPVALALLAATAAVIRGARMSQLLALTLTTAAVAAVVVALPLEL